MPFASHHVTGAAASARSPVGLTRPSAVVAVAVNDETSTSVTTTQPAVPAKATNARR